MQTEIPAPVVKRRDVHSIREKQAIEAGLDPILARIIASRPFLDHETPIDLLSPKLKMLNHPEKLADMDKAVARLLLALEKNEIIGIETDHDCDGQTSHAVIYTALTQFFGHDPLRIRSYIGHRLKEGYGLSSAVATRILAQDPLPHLIITADNGSADEAQIALLKSHGIDVIVTDHHEIPVEGPPQSALAVINPTRDDCQYPDRFIAGCMVAWLLMARTRQILIEQKNKVIPSLAECLDFVAVGTVADCVSMARSVNNRAVVAYGIKLIQQGSRPCWRALLPQLTLPIKSEDLGFKIGPLLNSDGRLACAFGSVSFLLAQNEEEANLWIDHLKTQNGLRKSIQDKVTQLALEQAKNQYILGKAGFCIFIEEGHAGVHGISASRIKDLFGRPVVILCPKEEKGDLLTGSARSIDGVHLRNILQEIHERLPGVLVRFGGHQGAAGLSIYRQHLALFTEHFQQIIAELHSPDLFGPVIWTDGELPMDNINISYIDKLVSQLEPFGREFEPPVFEVSGKICSLTPMGEKRIHARLGLAVEDLWFEAVWFNGREADKPWPVSVGDEIKLVFAPKLQTFRGNRQLSCQVVHLTINDLSS